MDLTKPDSRSHTKSSAGGTVLIAEDDPIFRRILQSWLQRWDYRVIAVDNGLDAWDALQKDDAPQMVVLDWMMPGMDGIELCRRIRDRIHDPYRYVLLLTAKDDKQDVVAGLEAGADDYLTKPFDVDELRARVRAGKRILELQDALLHAQDDLRFAAEHDPLTGLWNRSAILVWMKKEIERQRRTHGSLGLLMVDLDHFKSVNDTCGHLVGDVVLQEVARRLASAIRTYDSIGRYGGEEFLIVIPGCDAFNLAVTAERLLHAVADRPIDTCAGPITITLSVGMAAVEPVDLPSLTPETFLRTADAALYSAKAKGRNRVEGARAESENKTALQTAEQSFPQRR